MTAKPKPLTREEWEDYQDDDPSITASMGPRLVATLDALFRYRERTRGMIYPGTATESANEIAAELGIE